MLLEFPSDDEDGAERHYGELAELPSAEQRSAAAFVVAVGLNFASYWWSDKIADRRVIR